MHKESNLRIRRISKIGKGTYFTQNQSVENYFIGEILALFLKVMFIWLYLPYKLFFGRRK